MDLRSAYETTFLALELPLQAVREYIISISKAFPSVRVATLSSPDEAHDDDYIQGLRMRSAGQMKSSPIHNVEVYTAFSRKGQKQKRKVSFPPHNRGKKGKRNSHIRQEQEGVRHDPFDFMEEGEDRTNRRIAREKDEMKTENIELDY
jgi:hypothetical protein